MMERSEAEKYPEKNRQNKDWVERFVYGELDGTNSQNYEGKHLVVAICFGRISIIKSTDLYSV